MTTKPCPARFYWLKRLTLAGLTLVILLVGLRLFWGHRMQSRLDEAIADIQAQGEPILFEELAYEPLPASENAALLLNQALANWPTVQGVYVDDDQWYDEANDYAYSDPVKDNAAYLAQCKPVLDLIRQTRSLTDADWGVKFSRPVLPVNLPQLGQIRQLARLIDDATRRALDSGQTKLALEINSLLAELARHIQARQSAFINHLVGISIYAMQSAHLHEHLPSIDPTDLREGQARQHAHKLIASLTDDAMIGNQFRRCLVIERLASYDYFRCQLDGTLRRLGPNSTWHSSDPIHDTPVLRTIFKPLMLNAMHRNLKLYSTYIQWADEQTPYQAIEQQAAQFEDEILSRPLIYPILSELWYSCDAFFRTHLRCVADRRMAATALAIRLYQADHDGKRPERLEQLVPNYLSAVPTDPFHPAGGPIGYVPNGVAPTLEEGVDWYTQEQLAKLSPSLQPRAILYSVGSDGVDDGGGPIWIIHNGELETNRYNNRGRDEETFDQWFLLDPWPKPVLTEDELYGGDDETQFDYFDQPF